MRFLHRNEPKVAAKFDAEEREAGIRDHSTLPEKVYTDRRINPRTGREEKVADTRQRDRLGRPNEGSRDAGRGRYSRSNNGNGNGRHSGRNGNGSSRNGGGSGNGDQYHTPAREQAAASRRGVARNSSGMTREQAREAARGSGIEGWYRMNTDDLVQELENRNLV